MKFGMSVLLLLSFFTPVYIQQNADVPTLTNVLEQMDGSRISIRYRSIHWVPMTEKELKEDPDIKQYYDTCFNPRMAVLETNVQLAIGKNRLDPGRYSLGFQIEDDKIWYLIISDEQSEWLRLPFTPKKLGIEVPFLSFNFTPGVTDRDFIFNALYGNYALSLRWTFTGVPTEMNTPDTMAPVGLAPSPIGSSGRQNLNQPANLSTPGAYPNLAPLGTLQDPKLADQNGMSVLQAKPGWPNQSTSVKQTPAQRKQKAGSGAFRRLKNKMQTQDKK